MQLKWCIKFTKPRKPAYVAVGGFCPPPCLYVWLVVFNAKKSWQCNIYWICSCVVSPPWWYHPLWPTRHPARCHGAPAHKGQRIQRGTALSSSLKLEPFAVLFWLSALRMRIYSISLCKEEGWKHSCRFVFVYLIYTNFMSKHKFKILKNKK